MEDRNFGGFNLGVVKKDHQTAEFNSPPNIVVKDCFFSLS